MLYQTGPMEIFTLLFICLACAGYTGNVASSKGHDAGPWTVGGLLLGPLALLAALGLPDLKSQKYLRLLVEQHGGEVEQQPPTCPDGEVDVDVQRRRILDSW